MVLLESDWFCCNCHNKFMAETWIVASSHLVEYKYVRLDF